MLYELGGRPALERLMEMIAALSPDDRQLAAQGLHCGIVLDESKLDYERGDFVVRNVLGADRAAGAVAVGDVVEVGATVQFQVRDATSADEDLRAMLEGHQGDAALVFTCNGAGRGPLRRARPRRRRGHRRCSAWTPSQACSAPARWARWADETSSTASPRRWSCSVMRPGVARSRAVGSPGGRRRRAEGHRGRCAAWPWMLRTRPTAATAAPRWRWRPWPTCCGRAIMRYDPSDPEWPDRDRFVLSAGHASILQYSMLYLTGYGLQLDDLRAFRQWDSATPGHPEARHTAGVEVTTGPLGQGIGNAVGMAVAERWLRTRFGPELFDHRTFLVCGDGDLMEGVSHEAASLAGHLGLGRIVAVYDDNHITIDGATEMTFSDDVGPPVRGLRLARRGAGRGRQRRRRPGGRAAPGASPWRTDPRCWCCAATSAGPSPTMTDTAAAHGNPFSADEIRATKGILGLPDEPFSVPDDVLAWYREVGLRGREERLAWEQRRDAHGADRAALDACIADRGLPGWEAALPSWEPGEKLATRVAVGKVINATLPGVPGLLSGAADLTGNTGTKLDGEAGALQSARAPGWAPDRASGCASTPWGRPWWAWPCTAAWCPWAARSSCSPTTCAPRCASPPSAGPSASSCGPTTRSGVGEDGPTHQPVEHLAALRAMPGLRLIRPADANETATAFRVALDSEGPTALVLSRQSVPVLEGTAGAPVERGAYVLSGDDDPEVVLIGTGSEVQLCVAAAATLRSEGRRGAGRLHAVHGPVRGPVRRLPGLRPAPGRPPGVGRGRHHLRLAPLGRPLHRDRPLRRLGAGRRGPRPPRHHRRPRARRGPRRPRRGPPLTASPPIPRLERRVSATT